jgi:trimethylamine:corrinoid methyltransferase-like protein
MESNNITSAPSGYRMFTDAQLGEMYLASMEILRTGVRVYEAESLTILQDAGCVVTDGNLVRFPAAVEDALRPVTNFAL